MPFKFFTSTGQELVANSIADLPIGAIIDTAASSIPNGWLACDGSAISRTGYADLFGAIGTFYGTGDGSTTFNLPNLSGSIVYATPINKQIALGKPPAYVTSLPSNPIDGQEVYYVASATNGVNWHLRYNASSSSSYKWEFIGGPNLTGTVDTLEGNSITGWQNLATDGPSVTLPLAGDYLIGIGALQSTSDGNAQVTAIGFANGNATPASTDQAIFQPIFAANAQTGYCQFYLERNVTGVSASTAYKLRYYVANSASGHNFSNRRITAIPVRVG